MGERGRERERERERGEREGKKGASQKIHLQLESSNKNIDPPQNYGQAKITLGGYKGSPVHAQPRQSTFNHPDQATTLL